MSWSDTGPKSYEVLSVCGAVFCIAQLGQSPCRIMHEHYERPTCTFACCACHFFARPSAPPKRAQGVLRPMPGGPCASTQSSGLDLCAAGPPQRRAPTRLLSSPPTPVGGPSSGCGRRPVRATPVHAPAAQRNSTFIGATSRQCAASYPSRRTCSTNQNCKGGSATLCDQCRGSLHTCHRSYRPSVSHIPWSRV